MANSITTAFWSMTINNYTETELALVQVGYPDYMREIVYTLEVGEQGTPHIQAWIKLQRQQRMSFVRKLFPRAKFKPMTNDEYNLNTQRYAQKLDETAVSAALHRFVDPVPDPIDVLKRVLTDVMGSYMDGKDWSTFKEKDVLHFCNMIEFQMVREKPKLAKFIVSAMYKSVKKTFWRAVCANILETHTHTQPELFSQEVDIPTYNAEDDEGRSDASHSGSEGEDTEDNEDSQTSETEGYDEGSDDECSEQDTESEERD